MWHQVTVFYFLREFLRLALSTAFGDRLMTAAWGNEDTYSPRDQSKYIEERAVADCSTSTVSSGGSVCHYQVATTTWRARSTREPKAVARGLVGKVSCGVVFVSSFIGLKCLFYTPCDLLLTGLKVGWDGDEIDTTYRKTKQKILPSSVPQSYKPRR